MPDPRLDAPNGGESNKFYGEHVGIIESTDDPKKWYRVQVRVYGVFTDKVPAKDLPWAEIKLPVGARPNDGHVMPLKKGDLVWTDFPYDGDTRRPRITGSVHYCPDNHPNIPHEAWAGPDAYEHKRAGEEPAPAAHVYHEDEVSTQHGVTVERNKDGSYAIYQRSTGTELSITKEGHIILHGEKDWYFSSAQDVKGEVGGTMRVNIEKLLHFVAMKGVKLDGGSGDLSGAVSMLCDCPFVGGPHIDFSKEVQVSKG